MAVSCPQCGSEELLGLGAQEDGRIKVRCEACGHEWLRGEAKRVYKTTQTIDDLRKSFPKPSDVAPATLARANELKTAFLVEHPQPDPKTVEFRARYQKLFSKNGLADAEPAHLKYFANVRLAGNPGNMSVFNNAWNELGDEQAARHVRDVIGYLLYGPEDTYLEDRLAHLIEGKRGLGMTGFREALLTKVLGIVEPQRFLPINKYTGQAGKKEIARWVYGLSLPHPESVSWSIGRLIIWSNDLLRDLVGDGFADTEHAADFLWWAKDEVRGIEGTAEIVEEPDFVVFKNDDKGFRRWMREHRAGFYINTERSPSPNYLMLHRVGCMHVGDAEAGDVAWTHDYIKVCSVVKMELEAWARTVVGGEPTHCHTCTP